MAINLRKGQTINLEKSEFDLSKVTIGLGWKVRERKSGFLKKFLAKDEEDYDLDAIAALLDEDNHLAGNEDIVYYGNLEHGSGSVQSCGDNLVGGTGDSDDEQIICRLDRVPEEYKKILFLVAIYDGLDRDQSFGNVENAYIRAVDARGKEIARYKLSEEQAAEDAQVVVFAELTRNGNTWKFHAIGTPRQADSFIDVLEDYA